MPTLDTKFDAGDVVMIDGRYITIFGVVENDGTTQYQITKNGRFRSVDSLKIDRNAVVPRWYDD
jgi:hypothetical protein